MTSKAISSFAMIFVLAAITPALAVRYEIRDLGISGRRVRWASINDQSQILVDFESNDSGVEPPLFFVEGDQSNDIRPTFPTTSAWVALNDLGQVLGTVIDSQGDRVKQLYEDGQFQNTGILGTESEGIVALNNVGDFIGINLQPGSIQSFIGDVVGNTKTDLGTLGGDITIAQDINDAGQVVGASRNGLPPVSYESSDIFQEAFLYDQGVMVGLGTLGGSNSLSRGINSAGIVVGGSATNMDPEHAFIYDATNGMRDLGVLGLDSVAQDINDLDTIIGSAERTPNVWRAALFDETTGIEFLEDLISPDSGWDFLFSAMDINNYGQIVGTGVVNGETHAFLLTPIPEPVAEILLLSGLYSLLALRRRSARQVAR